LYASGVGVGAGAGAGLGGTVGFGDAFIPNGGLGTTSAVTGGAAGLGAGAIPTGVGASPWWMNYVQRAPSLVKTGVGVANNIQAINASNAAATRANAAANTAATSTTTTGTTPANTSDFDPTRFNNTGSTAKTGSGESQLVANNFADDPYRFSNN
jgi:hypothetical protein